MVAKMVRVPLFFDAKGEQVCYKNSMERCDFFRLSQFDIIESCSYNRCRLPKRALLPNGDYDYYRPVEDCPLK